ncbi:hypothetical protein AAMO2058_000805500 [Amorphochlora amoebiformis]
MGDQRYIIHSGRQSFMTAPLLPDKEERVAGSYARTFGQLILFAAYFTPMISIAITYPLSIKNGRVTENDFFVSSAMDVGIARPIGSFIFGIDMLFLFWVVLIRFSIVRAEIARAYTTAKVLEFTTSLNAAQTWNFVALGTSFISMCCMLGALAFNVGDPRIDGKNGYFFIHISFAFTGFFLMVFNLCINNRIDSLVLSASYAKPEYVHYFRWLLATGGMFCFAGMFFFLSSSLPLSSSMEIAIFMQSAIYYVTWHSSFYKHCPWIWRQYEKSLAPGEGYGANVSDQKYQIFEGAASTHLMEDSDDDQ